MFELFAFASIAPASARSHRRSAERHTYAHPASRHRHDSHARSSRFERGAAQSQARGFLNTQAGYDASANSGGSGLVSETRRYLGGNPTGRGSLWCARFMNMVLQHTGVSLSPQAALLR
jgi:hypothetical protein